MAGKLWPGRVDGREYIGTHARQKRMMNMTEKNTR